MKSLTEDLVQWSKDASQLLNSHLPPVLTLSDGSHVNVMEDHVFESLFVPVSEETWGFFKDDTQA